MLEKTKKDAYLCYLLYFIKYLKNKFFMICVFFICVHNDILFVITLTYNYKKSIVNKFKWRKLTAKYEILKVFFINIKKYL
jgi:hypothetical protein